jgi:hypothetical protein
MGGYGSTRWGWHTKKETVENCLELSVFRVVGPIIPDHVFADRQAWGGSLVWTNTYTKQQTASMGYELYFQPDGGAKLWLKYQSTFPNGEKRDSHYLIRLVTTAPHFGGVRWWFECPLVINGQACRRRVGKLYLPPSGVYFGCRHCYDLTYTSAQEAHKYDRLGGGVGELIRQLDRLMREERKMERENARRRRKR